MRVEEAAAPAAPCRGLPRARGRSVARGGVEEPAERSADVALELGLGDARLLEVEQVEHCVVGAAITVVGRDGAARRVRHAQADDARGSGRAAAAPRATRPARPSRGRRSTAVLLAERVEQADHVADEVQLRVLVDRLGAVGLRRSRACRARRRGSRRAASAGELVAPRVPGLGEAVAEQDERARALLGDVHADAVGVDACGARCSLMAVLLNSLAVPA